MGHSLFAKKSIARLEAELAGEQRLKRVLGPVALTGLGIGGIIGTGIFVLTGLAAREFAGPGLMLSFVFAGLGCTFAALCYAEFAAMIPVTGSAYTYSYATLGEFLAWIIGWDLILEYAMGSSTVSYGWSKYFCKLLGLFDIKFPIWISNDYWSAKHAIADATANGTMDQLMAQYSSITIPTIMGIPFCLNIIAFAIVGVITAILVYGIREGSRLNMAMVAIKLSVVLFVIFAGAMYVDPSNWTPFLPFGIMGVMAGAGRIFFSYIGFDAISTYAEEAKNPQRDIPIGILASLFICTLLYILVSGVITGMVKYDQIDVGAPLASAFSNYGLNVAVLLISAGGLAGITSVMLVMLMSQPRIFLAMSHDGLLPKRIFSDIHPKYKTPYKGTILTGAVSGTVAMLTPIDILADMVNIGTMFAFAIVCVAVLVLRKTNPDKPRPFRCPAVYIIAPLGVLSNLALMFFLGWANWFRLLIWLAIGMVIYFAYSRRHSVVGKESAA